jgi:ornithine cyclodeaminase/alanine dehydrogenase-like protein (mu-crystallin family)
MSELLVLSQAQVRELLDRDALFDALRAALKALSAGTASVPARGAATTEHGLLAAMPGFVPGHGLAAKLVTYFRDNETLGVPAHQALVTVHDPLTGTPLAVMDGTFLTAVRTATSAAVAAVALARPGATTLAVIGAGVQGASHLDAFTRGFRTVTDVRVASRSRARAESVAAGHPVARVVDSFEDAARGADLVALCTDADEPVVRHAWLSPGTHVSSVGSGHEVDPTTVDVAAVFVESRAVATSPFPAGSRELGGRDPQSVTEVGEVLLGTRPGRTDDAQVTLYKSMGHAVEDVAAATLVYDAAVRSGAGTRLSW